MIDYTDIIQSGLDRDRPDRYVDKSWIDQVADSIFIDANQMADLAREHLRRQARDIEAKRVKSANAIIRDYLLSGKEPLMWELVGEIPMSIKNVVIIDGEAKTVRERVKLSAATAKDFELWAVGEREAAEGDYKARLQAAEGAELWAQRIRESGSYTWAEYQKQRTSKAA